MNCKNIILIAFYDLTNLEKEMILKWRNHKNIRKWMNNSELILKKQHFEFIEDLKANPSNQYFLVVNNKINIGVVYFNEINNDSARYGLYTNPYEETTGLGSLLQRVSINYAFDKLKLNKLTLEVFGNNRRALNLYKKFNFTKVGKKIINKQEIIYMELYNENR